MRRHVRYARRAMAWACLAAVAASATAGEPPRSEAFGRIVTPFLAKHCAGCHGPSKPRAGLNVEALKDEATVQSRRRAWVRIREYIDGGLMPPEDSPQPDRVEVDRVAPRSRRRSTATTAASRPTPAA